MIPLPLFFEKGMGAEGTEGSLADLLWPGINFGIFCILLGIIMGKKAALYFKKNAQSVEESYHYAAQKSRMARLELEQIEKKKSQFEQKADEIKEEIRRKGNHRENKIKEQGKMKIKAMREELKKIKEHQEKTMRNDLDIFLTRKVVESTKKLLRKRPSKKIIHHLMATLDES